MKIVIITFALILTFCFSAVAQGTTQYVYDANGRLTHVVSSSGQITVYEYDFAGNLIRIKNQQTPILLITSFSPGSGSIGTNVTIRGVGFNVISAQNEVKFNGVLATVLTSTLTEITVTVPIGATSGKIQITNSLGTTLSSSNFNILQGNPSITSFTPVLGKFGDTVTINGSGYSSFIEDTLVSFYRIRSNVLSSSANQIQTVVPNNATSGKIKVVNDIGEAISNDYFHIVPENFNVSDVAQTASLNFDETYPVNIPSPKKLSLFVFEGVAGQRIYVGLKNVVGSPYLKIKTPSNSLIWDWFNSADLILPETGTYSISVESANELPVTLNLVVNNGRKINTDGTPEIAYLLNQGQDIELNFQAKAGQNYNLKISNATAVAANFSVISPSGQTVYSNFIDSIFTGAVAAFSTNESGNHKIVYDPILNVTGSATFELNLLNDIGGNLIINDPPKLFTSTIAGQGFRINFAGNSGQRFYLKTTTSDFYSMNLNLKTPNGTDLIFSTEINNDITIDVNNLPDSGNYTLLIYPNFPHQFGNITLQAVDSNVFIPDSITQSIHTYFVELLLGGKNKTINTKQISRLATFPEATYLLNAIAGQQFSFTTGSPTQDKNKNNKNLVNGTMTVFKPDGEELSSATIDTGFCNLTLPVAGEYRIVVSPAGGATDLTNSPNNTITDFVLRTDCGVPPGSRPIKNKGVIK